MNSYSDYWNEHSRVELLGIASRLATDTQDSLAVTAHAEVLRAWLDAGTDERDRRTRLRALTRANLNRITARHDADDDPRQLIRDAQPYYAFLLNTTALCETEGQR